MTFSMVVIKITATEATVIKDIPNVVGIAMVKVFSSCRLVNQTV
jgi:hypothetical protein